MGTQVSVPDTGGVLETGGGDSCHDNINNATDNALKMVKVANFMLYMLPQ
jgi:hypothetical protein